MGNCKTCKFSVFDEQQGMYWCGHYDHTIYILLEASECPNYKPI